MSETSENDQLRAERLLLEFLDGRDVECPNCSYNLRDLTQLICPECKEQLALSVGFARSKIGLVLAALIPGAFSGICAALLLASFIIAFFFSPSPSPIPPGIILIDGFGWLSGLLTWLLFTRRHAFLKQSRKFQLEWVVAIWLVHLGAFTILTLALL